MDPPPAGNRPASVVRSPQVGRALMAEPTTEETPEDFAHKAVEDAIARERARVARELHDGIATDLAGAITALHTELDPAVRQLTARAEVL